MKYFSLSIFLILTLVSPSVLSFPGKGLFMPKAGAGAAPQAGAGISTNYFFFGGHHWHLGSVGGSCTSVCRQYGGYNEATNTFAGGGGGTDSNCSDLINHFYPAGGFLPSSPAAPAIGCYYIGKGNFGSRAIVPTTADTFSTGVTRICACNEAGTAIPTFTTANVGGFDWILGPEGASCQTTCEDHGGYNEATRTYAGSDGSDANCQSVLNALGVPVAGLTMAPTNLGMGCFGIPKSGMGSRNTTVITNAESKSLYNRRACACNTPGVQAGEGTSSYAEVGGFYWYLGQSGSSCTDTCATHGGYNSATETFSGSSGTDANCQEVIASLGVSIPEFNEFPPSPAEDGLGCSTIEKKYTVGIRNPVTTTAAAEQAGFRRTCACNNPLTGYTPSYNSYALVGGFHWYLGNPGASCTSTCSDWGGYNAATLNYAGSAGSAANCTSVMQALGMIISTANDTSLTGFAGFGCFIQEKKGSVGRRSTLPTTEAAGPGQTYRRACACNNPPAT